MTGVLAPAAIAGVIHVGRERERTIASEHLRRARSGCPVPLLVTGAPGTGKSALLADIANEATTTGFRALRVHGDRADAGVPYASMRLALRDALAEDHVMPHVADMSRLLDRAAAGDATSRREARARLPELLRSVIVEWAFRSPVVVIVDDIHLADADSALATLFLMRHLRHERVLIVASSRLGPPDLDPETQSAIAEFAHNNRITVIELGAMDDSELAAMVVARCGAPPDGDLLRTLSRRTAGNPFFAMELIDALRADGALVNGGSELHLDASLAPSLPRTVAAATAQRMRQLGEDAARVAAGASLLGRVDIERLPLLARITDLDPDRVEIAFDRLVGAQVLEPAERGYRFTQPIVRDALYDDIGPGRRASLHGVVVDLLMSTGRPVATENVIEVARHAGLAKGTSHVDVSELFALAGDTMLGHSPRSAVGWYELALSNADGRADLAALRVQLGRALCLTGRHEDALATLQPLLGERAISRRSRDAATVVAHAHAVRGQLTAAARVVDDALAALGNDDALHAQRALIAIWQGDVAGAAWHVEVARKLAGHESNPLVDGAAMHVSFASGRFRDGWAFAARARQCIDDLPPESRAELLLALIDGEAAHGDPRVALRDVGRLRSAGAIDPRADAHRAWAAMRLGRWDDAATIARAIDGGGGAWFLAPAAGALALVLAERGDHQTAHEELARHGDGAEPAVEVVLAAARLHHLGGDPAAAVDLLSIACDRARDLRRADALGLLLGELAIAANDAGDLTHAHAVLDELASVPRDEAGIATTVSSLLARAAVARDADAAAEAQRVAACYELMPDAARAHALEGELRSDVQLLIDAYEKFDRLGAITRQRAVSQQLRRLGRRPPRTRRAGPWTPAEREIAHLVALGLTNRQIAERACLSPKTVEVYLSRIFIKAGCRSRVELAVLVNRGATPAVPPPSEKSGSPY